jgi:hypothetical protein
MTEVLSLQDIERSVKKVSDLVDININNLLDSFLVDNFEPVSVLRNTELRNEFNNLCKGKTESKNIVEKIVDNKKIYLCKEEQIRDIPPLLLSLFDKPKKYYIYGTPSQFSFYHSMLLIIQSDFILQGKIQKEKIIDDSRNNLVYELDDFYKKNNYKNKKFKKSVIRDNLLNSKSFLPQVNTYIADYNNVCLVIIDTETYLYSLINDYEKDKDFIIMLRKNNYYQPILNSEGNNKFGSEIIDKLSKILKPEFEIDKGIKNEMSNTNDKQSIEIDSSFVLLKETKYKVGELQEIAKKMGVETKVIGTNKNKKKSDLYKEIKEAFEK